MKKTNEDQERKLKKKKKKDFLNTLSSDNSNGHYKCEMCDETFAVQSVFRFHIQNVHTASISTITEACEIRDHSCQNDLLVQFLHADDTKGSRCGKCEKNPNPKTSICTLKATVVTVAV